MEDFEDEQTFADDDAQGSGCDEVTRHLETLEVVASVAVVPYESPGSFGLDVDIVDGPSLLLEATETWNSVRILDPDGEDVTPPQALDYLTLRLAGETPAEALKAIRAPKHRW